MQAILTCLQSKLNIDNLEVLTHTLSILVTDGWMKSDDTSFAYEAIECVSRKLFVPLQKANIDCSLLKEEWDDIIHYSRCYRTPLDEWKPDGAVQLWWNDKTQRVPAKDNRKQTGIVPPLLTLTWNPLL